MIIHEICNPDISEQALQIVLGIAAFAGMVLTIVVGFWIASVIVDWRDERESRRFLDKHLSGNRHSW